MKSKEAIALLIQDYKRWINIGEGGKNKSMKFIKTYYIERGFRYTVWMRLASISGCLGLIPKLILHHLSSKFGIQIHSCTRIGGGFYIGHGIGIVIHPKTIIGDNVSISQFLSIGSNKGTPAVIEDNVYLGPNVCLVENVRIGSHSIVGAGAVVTKDIPPYSVAVGVPAKVINHIN